MIKTTRTHTHIPYRNKFPFSFSSHFWIKEQHENWKYDSWQNSCTDKMFLARNKKKKKFPSCKSISVFGYREKGENRGFSYTLCHSSWMLKREGVLLLYHCQMQFTKNFSFIFHISWRILSAE